MLNIPNGYRPLITKLGIGFLVGFIIVYSLKAAAAAFMLDAKWVCGSTQELGKELRSAGEQIIGVGAADNAVIVSVWVNVETRSWTIVASPQTNKEVSCVVVHGSGFKPVAIKSGVSI